MSKYRITLNGKSYEMDVELMDGSTPVTPVAKAAPALVQAPAAAPKASTPVAATAGSTVAPMPGTILKVSVNVGDAVKAGDSIVVLEAMKMENDITAPKDGVVKTIAVAKGQTVAKGDVLFEVE
ncbi:MAG: biotin/lipoyl-binding protein [Saccharofermentans sp.]|nr:biotin/lipoyl-binding protein [Saccharofermentans sp.]